MELAGDIRVEEMGKIYDINLLLPVVVEESYEESSNSESEIEESKARGFRCTACGVDFPNRSEQTEHYRSTWHGYNVKQRALRGICLTEEEFCMREQDDDTENSPDLPSEDEEEQALTFDIFLKRLSPTQQFFRLPNDETGRLFSCYRCVLDNEGNPPEPSDLWAIFLLSGGRFAGAIYRGSVIECHKVIAKYTVRKKQGGSQLARDGAQSGSAPQSAGANLRRTNELALLAEIQDLLKEWGANLRTASRIFLRCPAYQRRFFYDFKGSPIVKDDPRVRYIPFVTHRPNFTEVKRIQSKLTTVLCYGSVANIEDMFQTFSVKAHEERMKKAAIKGSTVEKPPIWREISEPDDKSAVLPDIWQRRIYTAIRADDLESVELILGQYRSSEGADEGLLLDYMNKRFPPQGDTLLHMASSSCHLDTVEYCLRKLRCDATLKNRSGQTPYHVCGSKTVRNVFIKFRQDEPEALDWNAVGVPEPLDPETAAKKKSKDAERRKQAKKARAEKQKVQKEIDLKNNMEKAEKDRFLNLSDREKRALAAERRILERTTEATGETVVLSRCFLCGVDISGKVPFEYNGNRFCSMPCLKRHRQASAL